MSTISDDYPTRDVSLVGAAGVHAVVAELSLRGLIALPTIRNTAGVDIIVTNKNGNWHANLQVKTSRSKVPFWPLGKKYADWVGKHNFYVFLRFCKNIENGKEGNFEIFLEKSNNVAENYEKIWEAQKERGSKKFPAFQPLKNEFEKLKENWLKFGTPGHK